MNDHTPGYGSAARYVAQAFMGYNLDNRALPGVFIGVVMGRNAGFLTAAATLGRKYPDDGPHLRLRARAALHRGAVPRRREDGDGRRTAAASSR